MKQADLTDQFSDEYIWFEIRYLDPDMGRKCREDAEREQPISLASTVVLVAAIFLSFVVMMARI